MQRARGSALVVALALLGGCTGGGGEDVAPDQRAADAFLDAWADRDSVAMVGMLEGKAKSEWTSIELADRFDGVMDGGGIEKIGASRTGPLNDVAAGRAAPFEIRYTSSLAEDPVVLQGQLELIEDDAGWKVAWDGSLLPGIPNAEAFGIATKYLRRGAIVDRSGKPLAIGTGDARRYPRDAIAGSVIGHLEPLNGREARRLGREPGDLVGASGLEEAFEERLAGTPSTILAVVDAEGRTLRQVGSKQGAPGARVRTTLDLDVQRAAESAYGGTTGGAVVLAPRSGDLLAIVSSSPFDPGNYVGVEGIEPFNRALSGTYPPGSSMKVVTAAAALDTKTVTPSTQLSGPASYQGVRNFEGGDFGRIDFATATQNSVNTAFAQVALDLGAEKMTEYAERFGFNAEPKMPLAAATSSFPSLRDDGDLMWGAIGQAQVLATPLHMASVAGTIANGGKRMEPRITFDQPREGVRAVKPSTARKLTELMRRVVVAGTGTAANISGADVAGKTGTAEVSVGGEIKNHAWFVCFAPAGNPKVAVAVVSELGGVGGEVAAPLARGILQNVLSLVR